MFEVLTTIASYWPVLYKETKGIIKKEMPIAGTVRRQEYKRHNMDKTYIQSFELQYVLFHGGRQTQVVFFSIPNRDSLRWKDWICIWSNAMLEKRRARDIDASNGRLRVNFVYAPPVLTWHTGAWLCEHFIVFFSEYFYDVYSFVSNTRGYLFPYLFILHLCII